MLSEMKVWYLCVPWLESKCSAEGDFGRDPLILLFLCWARNCGKDTFSPFLHLQLIPLLHPIQLQTHCCRHLFTACPWLMLQLNQSWLHQLRQFPIKSPWMIKWEKGRSGLHYWVSNKACILIFILVESHLFWEKNCYTALIVKASRWHLSVSLCLTFVCNNFFKHKHVEKTYNAE